MLSYRSKRTPATAQLAVDDYWRFRGVASNHDFDELAQVGEVWRPFCSDRYTCISKLDAFRNVSALRHDVLQDHDVLTVDFFPDRDDRAVGGLGMQEQTAKE